MLWEVIHFANATELDRIKSKGPILLYLIRSNSVRFSLGVTPWNDVFFLGMIIDCHVTLITPSS